MATGKLFTGNWSQLSFGSFRQYLNCCFGKSSASKSTDYPDGETTTEYTESDSKLSDGVHQKSDYGSTTHRKRNKEKRNGHIKDKTRHSMVSDSEGASTLGDNDSGINTLSQEDITLKEIYGSEKDSDTIPEETEKRKGNGFTVKKTR